jgi:hypothetical protein
MIAMNTFKKHVLALALGLVSTAAFASGDNAEKALQTTADMKTGIVENIAGMDVGAMRLNDATVEIKFTVDAQGKLIITGIESESTLVEKYVKKMLKDVHMVAAEHLSNKSYSLTVRYVRL